MKQYFLCLIFTTLLIVACQETLTLDERQGEYIDISIIRDKTVKEDATMVMIGKDGLITVSGKFNGVWDSAFAFFTNTITNKILTIEDFCIIEFKSEKTIEVTDMKSGKKTICEKLEDL